MKRTFTTPALFKTCKFALAILMLSAIGLQQTAAQITGVKNIPGDYADLAAAITDLNTVGVGAGGVTLNLLAGNPQTTPLGGYSITTLTGSAANPIILEGNNNTITAFSPQTVGSRSDAIFKIIGGDFITIQNYIMVENAANMAAPAIATNNQTEFGVALFIFSGTDGAQNNTIQNNTITLSNATVSYQNAIGIFSTSSSSSTNGALAATATSGTNSNNKFYKNIISGVAYGMYFICEPITAAIFESGNDIGGAAAGTGNTVTFGNNVASDIAWTRFSAATEAGIVFRNGAGNTARFNTINSIATLTIANAGIFVSSGTAPIGVTYTSTFSNNTITLTNTGTTAMTGIDFGHGIATGTIVGSNNTINLNQIASAAVSAALTGIKANYTSATNTLNTNAITVTQDQSAGATTSAVTLINAGGVGTTVNVANNNPLTIKQNAPTGAGSYGLGAITYINASAASATVNVTGNNLNTVGSTIRSTGTLIGVNQDATVTVLVNIKSNTLNVDRIAASGSVTFCNTSGSPSEVADTVSSNNITFTGLAGTSTAVGITSSGGPGTPFVGAKSITHNTISITGTHTGATTGITYNFSNTAVVRYNSVTINCVAATITGINAASSSSNTILSNNTLSLTSSTTAPTAMTAIAVAGGTGAHSVFNNLVTANNFTGVITTAPTVNGISITAGTGVNMNNNVVGNASVGAAGSTSSPVINGIVISGVTSINVFKNKIADLTTGANGASTLVSGIRVTSGTTVNLYNNLIGNLTAASAASTDAIRGINLTSTSASSAINVYYNTVHLNASGPATFGTTGIFHTISTTASTAVLNMRNNIIVNNSTPGTTAGLTVAYRRSAGAANNLANYASTSNNNLFYAGVPGAANLIYSDGTSTAQTLAAYKTGVFTAGTIAPRDANSVTENPPFLSLVSASANFLHINGAIATQVESGGVNIATYTDDYDGQTRQGNPGYAGTGTAPDLGADEGDFILLDLSAPIITYTSLVGYCGTGDASLSGVVITDATGVPTTGALRPRIYYKKNAGAFFSQPGTLISGSGTNGTWSFNIVAADMGGLAIGDMVSYYVIAQDIVATPNISSNPSGVIATDVNTVTTHPPTLNAVTVLNSLNGTYTVGVGGNYATLTAAITDYNAKCLGGPVVFSLTDAVYGGETYPITINQVSGASAFNTLTIKPAAGVSPSFTGTSATALIVLNGADFIVINGSNGNTANTICPASSATRDLTLTNTNTSLTSAVIWLQTTGTNGTTDNKVINCNLVGSGNTQTLFGVGMGNSTIAINSLGTGNNNNSFVNNNISKVQYGLYSQGASATNKNTGNIFNQNLVNTASPNNVRRAGVVIGFENNVDVSGNNISGIESAVTTEDVFGIALGNNAISTTTFTGDEVTNAVVSNNIIGTVRQTNTYSAAGIFICPATAGTNRVSNNTISGVSANGTSGDFTAGILIGGGAGSTTQVYYNTVSLSGTQTGGNDRSYGLAVGGTNPVIDIRNNIFVNTQNNGTGNNYAIGYNYNTYTNLTSDNNDFFVTNPGATFFIGATVSLSAPTNQATLAALQAATGKDGLSVNINPVFASATDLHLMAADPINAPLLCGGKPVSVTTDIDCATRNTITTTIGADEIAVNFSASVAIAETSGLGINDGIICNGASATLTASGGGTYVWSTSATSAAIVVSPIASTTYTVTVTNGSCSTSTTVTISVNPSPTASIALAETSGTPNDGITCAGSSVTLTASGGGTYLWSVGSLTTAVIMVAPLTTTTYTVTVTNANGCTATASTTITVNPLPSAGINIAETSGNLNNDGKICTGASVTLTATGGGTYMWSVGGFTTAGILVAPSATTTYTVTVTSAAGCTASASTTITVDPIPTPSISVSPNDTICSGTSATLTASGGGTYLWSTLETTAAITVTPAFGTTYTVTVTSAAGCTASTLFTIYLNASPVLSANLTQPSTCVSADGAIDLLTFGSTYNWSTPNGSGLVNGQQDQSGLTVGTYFVTVTNFSGCSATAAYALPGPGGCELCPTIPTLTASAGALTCQPVTLTASGLMDMGITYGIQFKYFLAPTANPYTGGTLIATVPNAGLVGNTATANGIFSAANTYFVYAILSPVPSDPSCRPSATATVVVNTSALPVATPSAQTVCSGAPITKIVLSSSVPNTTYTWVRDNTVGVTGIAANGSGDISGTLTNTTAAPITVTFTITPSANGCQGASIAATVLVNPTPNVTASPSGNTLCSDLQTDIMFSGTVAGTTYSWVRDNVASVTGAPANGVGNISAVLHNTTLANVTVTFTVTPSANGCMGTPITVLIVVHPIPTVNDPFDQTVCNGNQTAPVIFTGNSVTTAYGWTNNNVSIGLGSNANGSIPAFMAINTGTTPQIANLTVTPRYQDPQTANLCFGAAQMFTITVNPTPNANAAPAAQTICSGAAITAIVLTGNVANTTFTWSRNNTANVVGIAANGAGNSIAGSLANLTAAPITVTFTITPTANGCPGAAIMATVLVNPTPNAVAAPAAQTICSGATITPIVLSGNVANTAFNWTRDNAATVTGIAASGSGNISGALTNTTGAPITVTFTITPTANGCSGVPITTTVLVNPVPTLFVLSGGGSVCTGDNIGATVMLSGSQVNVNYQLRQGANPIGAPVAGTGAAISFGPQLAGSYTVVATHTQGGCTSVMTGTILVTNFDCKLSISDPCVCKNNATTLTNGQFDETIKVNAPDGQVWTVTAVSGFYSALSSPPPNAPSPITVGTTMMMIGGNMYTLSGIHVDAIGYTISVSNGRGTTLSIGNSCSYPNPSFTSVFPAEFCLFSDPVVLTGNPGDANIVSQEFRINGVLATTFDPGQGTGTYTIVYTVNGGIPKAANPSDPGCVQSVSAIVQVVTTPTNLVCNDLVYVSLDASCNTQLLNPDDVLEGTYLCFDDYVLDLDKNVPFGNGPWFPGIITTADIGNTYQVRVTHLVSGNTCWGLLKVEDKLAPVLTCLPFDIPCNTPDVSPANLKNLGFVNAIPATSDCQPVTLTYIDVVLPELCPTGLSSTIFRNWTAVDASGNTSTCIQEIGLIRPTLIDVVVPPNYDDIDEEAFSCEDNLPIVNGHAKPTPDWIEAQGLQGYPYVFGHPSGCTINWEWHDFPIEVCDGTIKYRREWTIVDWCAGDGFIYNQILKVLDETGPAFDCPTSQTVSTDPFTCCATINLPDVIVEDNCSRVNKLKGMIRLHDPETGLVTGMIAIGGTLEDFPGNNWWDRDTLANFGWTSCLPIGPHVVTYIAEDDCGNTSSCTFNLTVRDLVPPVASCDETTTVAIGNDDPFDCYGPAGPNNVPIALDACEFGGVTWVKATVFNDASHDNCNNLKFTVRRMPPYSDCINALNNVRGAAACDSPIPSFPPTPSEFQRATEEQDSIKFYCCEVGTTQTIILAVYQIDALGNIMIGTDGEPIKNECMIQVEVQDKLKPSCVPPAQVSVNCENFDPSLWTYGKATIADNCCLDTSKVYQGQCGLSHSVNYALFDTVCNKGTITRTFRAFDCHGLSSSCTQRVIVTYDQDYFIKFPNDAIVTTCDGTGNFGEPIFFGEDCELLGVSFEDEVFTVVPDACFKIERTWQIINWCTYDPNLPCIYVPNPNPNAIANHPTNLPGPTVSACGTLQPWKSTIVKILPTDPLPGTDYCEFWDKNANCYKYKQIIKIIDGQAPTGTYTVPDCSNQNWFTPNRADLWNEAYWWDNGLQIHDLCEEPTDLCITGTDACSGSNVNIEYLLFLDLDGNGSMETVINSVNTGIAGLGWNNVLYNNLNTPNFSGGTPSAFDERAVPANQKYGFAIQETITGNNKTACVRWNTQQQQNTYVIPELPHGTHKIKWFITDGCGNNKEYEYTFTVKDCKAPTVVCLNGLSVNIMPTGMITMWASDFLQYTEDNCTPNPLKIGIRKCGTGTGFPVDAFGNPITSVNFTCAEQGSQCVELWAIDAAGNADYCETYVIVQDNLGSCGAGNTVNVSGALKTELGDGIEEALVSLQGPVNLTDTQGNYSFNNVPIGASFSIVPEKDDNPLNGVTTYDLVLISKHILGLEPLNTPYKMIAADANKSGSITTFDIVEIRKLILGIYNELPSNTSWRFVDQNFQFPNVLNPFQTQFPEFISVSNILVNQADQDFIGVKIGDLNNSAVANALTQAEERTQGTALFDIQDREVKAGETFEVTFKAAQALKGFQFTIMLHGLKAIGTVDAENVNPNNFNLLPENAMAVSIDGAQEFTVRFRAEKAGKLSEMLSLSGSITRAEAYPLRSSPIEEAREGFGVALRFDGKTIAGLGFELYQNQPNPFVNRTFVGFFLPEAAEATLSVFDETGRVVYKQKGRFAKGDNTIALDRALINTTGLLYYKLETATDSATKKMIQAK